MSDFIECACNGCWFSEGKILSNGYCQDCFDKECDNNPENH